MTEAEPPELPEDADDKLVTLDFENIRPQVEPRNTSCEWECAGRCRQVWIDLKTRMLHCKTCGRVIDPFDYLLSIANGEMRLVIHKEALTDQIHKLHDEVQALKQRRSYLRAQVRKDELTEKGKGI